MDNKITDQVSLTVLWNSFEPTCVQALKTEASEPDSTWKIRSVTAFSKNHVVLKI